VELAQLSGIGQGEAVQGWRRCLLQRGLLFWPCQLREIMHAQRALVIPRRSWVAKTVAKKQSKTMPTRKIIVYIP